jgi:hypothetical protein
MITETYLQGDKFKTALLWTAGRTLELWLAMKIAGQEDRLLERSLAGSLSVQAFVSGWMFLSEKINGAKIPSEIAIENRDPLEMLATTTARAVLIGTGMYIAGFRDGIVRDSVAGALTIEAVVIAMNLTSKGEGGS